MIWISNKKEKNKGFYRTSYGLSYTYLKNKKLRLTYRLKWHLYFNYISDTKCLSVKLKKIKM